MSAWFALLFEAALAFQKNLADISLGTRFLVTGLTDVWVALTVAGMLSERRRKLPAGFSLIGDDAHKAI